MLCVSKWKQLTHLAIDEIAAIFMCIFDATFCFRQEFEMGEVEIEPDYVVPDEYFQLLVYSIRVANNWK